MREHFENILAGKKLLIFGGAGSLGTALVEYYRQICHKIVVVSRDEAKHWTLKNKLGTHFVYRGRIKSKTTIGTYEGEIHSSLKTVVCDVRDINRVKQVLRTENPDYVIIAQALKQIDTCENNPGESIDTNITGVRNVLEALEEVKASTECNIQRVCFVSTDKACNPVNVYGMCKSISERMVEQVSNESKIDYVTTRYGNVLSTTGSIIPLFLKQATDPNTKAFTVTNPEMTRFMMLLEDSVELIDDALNSGSPGIWIPKLDSFCVKDLAMYFSEKYNKPFTIIGTRPGEKLHELLFSDEEAKKLTNEGNRTFRILTEQNVEQIKKFSTHDIRVAQSQEFSSKDTVISQEELKHRLDSFLEKGFYVKNLRPAQV